MAVHRACRRGAPEAEPTVDERIATLEAALATMTAERDKLASERAQLRTAHERVLEELEPLRRRSFVAEAERVDTRQLELEFMLKKAELDQLAGAIPDQADSGEDEGSERSEAPATIEARRDQHLRPEMDAFFARATAEYDKVKDQRGSLRSAFGYALRQRDALMRVCDDGRLHLDNNRSERALMPLAIGRKNWLFVGSDDHASSAANLLSLIASARLHRLDPELYLRDLIRVLPHWPKDRYLELSPKHWAHTRARLDTARLDAEFGPLQVPEPPQQQPSPN